MNNKLHNRFYIHDDWQSLLSDESQKLRTTMLYTASATLVLSFIAGSTVTSIIGIRFEGKSLELNDVLFFLLISVLYLLIDFIYKSKKDTKAYLTGKKLPKKNIKIHKIDFDPTDVTSKNFYELDDVTFNTTVIENTLAEFRENILNELKGVMKDIKAHDDGLFPFMPGESDQLQRSIKNILSQELNQREHEVMDRINTIYKSNLSQKALENKFKESIESSVENIRFEIKRTDRSLKEVKGYNECYSEQLNSKIKKMRAHVDGFEKEIKEMNKLLKNRSININYEIFFNIVVPVLFTSAVLFYVSIKLS